MDRDPLSPTPTPLSTYPHDHESVDETHLPPDNHKPIKDHNVPYQRSNNFVSRHHAGGSHRHNASMDGLGTESLDDVDVDNLLSEESNRRKSVSGHEALPNPPYSAMKVWIIFTTILVCYVSTLLSTIPISTQYFSFRIAKDLYNFTVNVSSSSNKCLNSSKILEDHLNRVQQEASSTLMYAAIASSLPSMLVCLVLGSYSDYLGRRWLVMASVSGGLIKMLSLLLIIQLELDIRVYWVGSVLDGLMGSTYSLTLAGSAVVADITMVGRARAMYFAILEGFIFVSGALSQVAAGYLINGVGFLVPVAINMGLLAIALLATVFILPETMVNRTTQWNFHWNPAVHLKKVFGFYLHGNARASRTQYLLGLFIFLTMMLINLGRLSVETLFVMNTPICWDAIDIGIYNSIKLVVMSTVAVIVLRLLRNRLSLETTAMVCLTSGMAGFVFEGFATDTMSMYLAALVGVLYGAVTPMPKALLSLITSPLDQGAMFSSLSTVEAFASMISSTIYTLIYNATVNSYKGAVFMAMAMLCCINFGLFLSYRIVRARWPPPYNSMTEISDPSVVKSVKARNVLEEDESPDEEEPLLFNNN